ncbi:hypothetical protein LSH36_2g12015 [Paralvinella palmiformis]|uniref:Gamma-aminobutyric acid receptor subunit beta n=1 Tax=Paralvinella palmiformis TaxID=53620 RepID=A0AAD9KFX3_9ANNE|nr:hypothetical protein LSH36_2g12015 [Paralvinella palmiformis]
MSSRPKYVYAIEQPKEEYKGESANISRLLDSLQKGYDKRLRPNFDGPPVEVAITMHIASVSSISEVDMDFTLDMYFRQMWTDSRLKFSEIEAKELAVSNEMLGSIWWPDTFFANSKHTKFHDVTTKNAFLRIKSTGEIYLSLRLTVTAMCNMDLTYFPMDTQECTLEIESYGYSTKDISYTWKADPKKRPVTLEKGVQLPQFKVAGTKTEYKLQQLASGDYSRLSCRFVFVRSLGYYVIQIYVPSCLIVVLSWVSFWLSRDAVPARVALGITTVLTMTTLISSTNASLPKISYLKSIDVYLVTCFVMVFASLLEYAAVSYLSNRQKRKMAADSKRRASDGLLDKVAPQNQSPIMYRKSSLDRVDRCEMIDPVLTTEIRVTSMRKLHTECDLRSNLPPGSVNAAYPPTCRNSRTPENVKEKSDNDNNCLQHPSMIDMYSRVLFPVVFLAFNTMYWITYIKISVKENLEEFIPPDAD